MNERKRRTNVEQFLHDYADTQYWAERDLILSYIPDDAPEWAMLKRIQWLDEIYLSLCERLAKKRAGQQT